MSQSIEQPVPQGIYLPAVRNSDIIYTSGMTPRKAGILMYSGKIQMNAPLASYRDAVRLATSNALVAAQGCLKKGEKLERILQLSISLNVEQDFTEHAKIADYASKILIEYFGVDNRLGARTAIGVASLPSNAPVEVALIGAVA